MRVREPASRRGAAGISGQSGPREKHPPKRCCGSYIADCQGCCYFARPLFDPSYAGTRKGRCERFNRDLVDEGGDKSSRIVVEK